MDGYHHRFHQAQSYSSGAYSLPFSAGDDQANYSPVEAMMITHNHNQTPFNRPSQLERVTEMRKEKSRDAARSRRSKENYEFLALSRFLPLPGAITSQLDKASVVRLAITNLKLRKFGSQGDPKWKNLTYCNSVDSVINGSYSALPMTKESIDANYGSFVLQAHDGFVVATSANGTILYISETVSVYLGLSQVELTGCSLFEYIHEDDRIELANALCIHWDPSVILSDFDLNLDHPARDDCSTDSERTPAFHSDGKRLPSKPKTVEEMGQPQASAICVRFRSTLTKRGVQMKYSGYRVLNLQWWPRFRSVCNTSSYSSIASSTGGEESDLLGYTMCATALPSLNMNEMRLDKAQFIMKLSLDFKILSVDPNMDELLQQRGEYFSNGISLYDACYGGDIVVCQSLHHDVLRKGQAVSDYYRMNGRKGGYFWVQTCAHLMVPSGKSPNEQCIIALHNLISRSQPKLEVIKTPKKEFLPELEEDYSLPVLSTRSIKAESVRSHECTPKIAKETSKSKQTRKSSRSNVRKGHQSKVS